MLFYFNSRYCLF